MRITRQLALKLIFQASLRLCLFFLAFIAPTYALSDQVGATVQQSSEAIRETAKQFLTTESNSIANARRVEVAIGNVDPKLNLTPCALLEAFMPSGSRLWGKVSVGVRCIAPQKWSVYVPGTIKIWGTYYITARTITQGHAITEADLSKVEADLTTLPNGLVTQASQAIGRTSVVSLAAGMPIRQDNLRAQQIVLQGQTIRLISEGSGFNVSTEGQALNSASQGQLVKVKISSGQVISGIAKVNGVVEVGGGT